MLHRANEDLKEATLKQQEEVEEWKASCDRLSSSLARKENESASLKEKLKDANDQVECFVVVVGFLWGIFFFSEGIVLKLPC